MRNKAEVGDNLLTDRKTWIDFGKLLAIFAVMTDHTYLVLYHNPSVQVASFFSVSLFILISGYNVYGSYSKKPYGIKETLRKCLKILIPYCVAVFVFEIADDYSFSLDNYLTKLIHFNAAAPHYYVLLYVQLMILAPILCWLAIKYRKAIQTILIFAILIIISIYTTNYTDLLSVRGGGGTLFGGTYLVLFYLGMIVSRERDFFERIGRFSYGIIPLIMVLIVFWVIFISNDQLKLDSKLMFGRGYNPPSVSFSVYAILVFMLLIMSSICAKPLFLTRVFGSISKIGKHTLYIFLYHMLFISYNDRVMRKLHIIDFLNNNMWMKRIWLFSMMIWGSILIEKLFCYLGSELKRVYLNEDHDDKAKKINGFKVG